ncbi:GlxA family transcriptional regulator [Albibacillus kandeliae]|uniref:GlxA family transcriptional regulator n=1 Tax=Albibacillus kandeliae TaxID=2174228 RepID=UPI000D69E559|nr:GlxA family transcriptional regulator [Albibacillus kandeliae]
MKSAKNIFQRSEAPLNVAVLVLDDCNTLSFAAGVDPMRAANRLGPGRPFDWSYVTATEQPARLTSGLAVPGTPIARLEGCDLMLVIAGFNLDRHGTPALLASLRRLAARGTTIAGIDGGPWLLAKAGLLDGYRATTHWEDLDGFAANFPSIEVLHDRYHVDRDRMTSGGATPAIDMMLHLIAARCGERLATRVAGVFIYDSAPDPARAQRRAARAPRHSPLTARAHALMEEHLETPLTLAEIARRTGTSPRSLQAQFRSRLGATAQAHYLALRLAEAQRLVTDTAMSLTDIGLATGFASQSSFSRAFRAAYGRSAREVRSGR